MFGVLKKAHLGVDTFIQRESKEIEAICIWPQFILVTKAFFFSFFYQFHKWFAVQRISIYPVFFSHDSFYFSIINKPNVTLVYVCGKTQTVQSCWFWIFVTKIFQQMNEWRFCLVKNKEMRVIEKKRNIFFHRMTMA